MFQRRTTLYLLVLPMCVVAGHLCAGESLLEGLGIAPSAAHAAPKGNGECPSHSENDSAKHKEGQLCGTSALVEAKTPVSEAKIVFVSFISSLVTVLSENTDTNSLCSAQTENFSPQRCLQLLSAIAANAPPTRA